MIQAFKNHGYQIVDFEELADIYIINTCTVTNMSDRKSRQILRHTKKNNPNSVVVAVGCYVQVAKNEIEQIPEIDFSLGNNEKKDIVKYVEEYMNKKEKIEELDNVLYSKEYCEFGEVTYTEKTRAVIKVQDGCDRFCTYCIIPYARGRVRSRKPENILDEIKKISKQGIKEVSNNYRLIDLLEEINEIEGIKRIRLGSIEPLLITEEFINRLTKLEKICHHFHLSLQSGSTKTLERMNRRYNIEEFEKIVKRLRDAYKDVILTTDIIVGFPGETKEEFNETLEFLKRIKFYKMHIFKYSPRKGTKAAEMKNQIQGDIKEERSKVLLELSDENEKEYLKKYIQKEVEVLFEEKDGEYYKGHTSNYIMVKYKTNKDVSNKIMKVYIKDVEELNLIAE